MASITKQQFIDWLNAQPDDRKFDITKNYPSDCMCPMMACAIDLGFKAVTAYTNGLVLNHLGSTDYLHCYGWGMDLFGAAFGEDATATAKQLRDYINLKEALGP